ncbi:MAG: hypothetical protein ACD_75C00805G0001, partial [uncultured bacterium]
MAGAGDYEPVDNSGIYIDAVDVPTIPAMIEIEQDALAIA